MLAKFAEFKDFDQHNNRKWTVISATKWHKKSAEKLAVFEYTHR